MKGPLNIEMKFWFPDRRKADLTNKAESIMDLLVDAGIIEDDNVNVCPRVWLEFCGMDREAARVEIYIINHTKL